jgi:hypothetical protein
MWDDDGLAIGSTSAARTITLAGQRSTDDDAIIYMYIDVVANNETKATLRLLVSCKPCTGDTLFAQNVQQLLQLVLLNFDHRASDNACEELGQFIHAWRLDLFRLGRNNRRHLVLDGKLALDDVFVIGRVITSFILVVLLLLLLALVLAFGLTIAFSRSCFRGEACAAGAFLRWGIIAEGGIIVCLGTSQRVM